MPVIPPPSFPPPPRCVYCGEPLDNYMAARGWTVRSTACRKHAPLIRLDPRYLGDLSHLQLPAAECAGDLIPARGMAA